MKKILIAFLMFFTSSCVFGAHQLYADRDGVQIPYGTKLELSMASDLTTQRALEGDMFQAYLTKDIYVNNKLAIPKNTTFRGRVGQIKYSRSLSRPAQLYLTFDHMVTKQGYQLPLSAGLSTSMGYILRADGALTTEGNYFRAVQKDAKNSTNLIKKSINWGKDTGENAQYVFVPIGVIGGAIGCAGVSVYSVFADLFRHGDEVILKKGEKFEVLLLNTLDVPI